MSFPNDRTYSYDANNVFSDNAAAYTASGYLQAGGSVGILDLGGNQGTSPVENARIDAVCVVDVTALDATTTDEAYRLILAGSNDPAWPAGSAQVLSEMEIAGGVLSVLGLGGAGVTKTGVIGRYEMAFTNNVAGNFYQYVKLYHVLTGTTPSISYEAFIAVLPEP